MYLISFKTRNNVTTLKLTDNEDSLYECLFCKDNFDDFFVEFYLIVVDVAAARTRWILWMFEFLLNYKKSFVFCFRVLSIILLDVSFFTPIV